MNKDFQNISKNIFGPFAYKVAVCILAIFLCLGTLAPFICNDQPILAKSDHGFLYPWSNASLAQKVNSEDVIISPPIPFNNKTIDKNHLNWSAPFQTKTKSRALHIMGTSKLGKDVFAGMIYGTRTALFIGLLSMLIAFIVGTSLGVLAGYYQNKGLAFNLIQIVFNAVIIILVAYYLVFGISNLHLPSFLFLSILITIAFIGNEKLSLFNSRKYNIPVDTIVMKLFEIRKSIPLIYLLLAATAVISKQSIGLMSTIIGLSVWVPFARHSRAGTLSLVNEGHVLAAKSLGLKDYTIVKHHILKDLLPQLLVVAALGMSGAILLESSLSFLGMGMPIEGLTWGSMLAEAKQRPSAWWMAIFPGFGIFLTVLSCNIIGERWSQQSRR